MKDIEQVLLSDTSFDELIKLKIDQEFKPKQTTNKYKSKLFTEIKDVPREKIFSKNTIFRVYNRKNLTQTCINGIQAEALLGIQTDIREKILSGTLTSFSTDDAYVKFEKTVL